MRPMDNNKRAKEMFDSQTNPRSTKTTNIGSDKRSLHEGDATDANTGQRPERNVAATNWPVILLAEDNQEMRILLAQTLRAAGYRVSECIDGWNLLKHLHSFILPDSQRHDQIDLVISDIRMPGLTAFEILEGVEDTDGFPPIILITAFGDDDTHAQAEKFGVAAIFDKPFEIDDLLETVRKIVPH